MVESSDAKEGVFGPTEIEKKYMFTYLGEDAVVDPGFKGSFLLSKVEAEQREKIISDIEYDFQLALKKGEYYLGNAVINFYVNKMPEQGELFLNCNALAISRLTINDKLGTITDVFKNQRIALETPHVELGWNTVQLSYMSSYSKNCVGLHTYLD